MEMVPEGGARVVDRPLESLSEMRGASGGAGGGSVVDAAGCSRCGGEHYLTAYWDELLCQECSHALAEFFDQKGEWPPDPWASVG